MAVSAEALVFNGALENHQSTSNYMKNVALHSNEMKNLSSNAACLKKAGCSLTRVPSSSCEALRCAVAALNRLDDFTCEKIGAGFFSEVFKVTHRTTGQVMVLKMNTSLSNRSNMLREVQLMNRLSHENILRFMGVCVHEGQLHALTEYINGGSLEQLLQNKQVDLPWETRIKLSLDISRGMCYLHSRGVFHRDLTSKNVLIKRQGSTLSSVVGDFGLAERIPDSRDKSQRLPIVGSPYWMAPECLKGEWYNERADVFSFGIIMCEIIARIEADPDILPRTENFGVDYVAFSDMCPECPPQFLELAFTSCRIDSTSRPSFKELVILLEKLLNIISSMSGGSQYYYPPVVTYTSCGDEGDNIDSVHAIFAHGWSRPISSSKIRVKVTPEKEQYSNVTGKPVPVTPKHIGEVMSLNDPHYKPNSSSQNPFASLPRFWKGKKFLEPTNFSDPDLSHSLSSFELPSPACAPTPPGTPASPVELVSLSVYNKNRKISKSLPASPELQRKCVARQIAYSAMSTEEVLDSPRSVSPGLPFSPPSSLSPYDTDEPLFSSFNSVHAQLNDCKTEDPYVSFPSKLHATSVMVPQTDAPEAIFFQAKTPSLCAKLRRSSGESGFFSVGDRNSTCDLSLDSCHNQEDTSWVTDGNNEHSDALSNIEENEHSMNKKRPSSFYSDDSGCSCGLQSRGFTDSRLDSANGCSRDAIVCENDVTKPPALISMQKISDVNNHSTFNFNDCSVSRGFSCPCTTDASSSHEQTCSCLHSKLDASSNSSCSKEAEILKHAQSMLLKNRLAKYVHKSSES